MGQSDVRQAARRQAQEAERRYREQLKARTGRLRRHAETVIVALAERDAVIEDRNRVAGAALLAMTAEEHMTLAEAVAWCGGATQGGRPGGPVAGSPSTVSLTSSEATRLMRWARLAHEAAATASATAPRPALTTTLMTTGAAATHSPEATQCR